MSFGESFYLTTSSRWKRLLRNLRLLGYIFFIIWTWLVVGGRVRRACRTASRTGQPYYIDELASGEILGKHPD